MLKPLTALDVGGANLKAVHFRGAAVTHSFALWKNPAGLTAALRTLLGEMPYCDRLAVTMTGELCDCFPNKQAGVRAILDAVAAAAGDIPIVVWQLDSRFVTLDAARQVPLLSTAANWSALATFCAMQIPNGCGLVIDIGSTTTDIIPIVKGRQVAQGRTDRERLLTRELVYTGVRRTPLCSLMGSEGAAEFFATTLDVFLILGWVPETHTDHDTADGRPATRQAAVARLARMLCADSEDCAENELHQLARDLAERQIQTIADAVTAVASHLPVPATSVYIAGSGEFLARRVIARLPALRNVEVISFAEHYGEKASIAACAFALMKIASAEPENCHARR